MCFKLYDLLNMMIIFHCVLTNKAHVSLMSVFCMNITPNSPWRNFFHVKQWSTIYGPFISTTSMIVKQFTFCNRTVYIKIVDVKRLFKFSIWTSTIKDNWTYCIFLVWFTIYHICSLLYHIPLSCMLLKLKRG